MSSNNPWLLTPAPVRSPSLRLFCFAHAGGAAVTYRNWPALLPASVEMNAIQLPGRATRMREPAIPNISTLAEQVAEAITPRLDVPFVFFGHSMGAVLSFEVARVLLNAGDPTPEHLIVSGRRPPRVPSREPDIRHLPDDGFLRELNGRYGGIPAELLQYPDVLALLVPSVRADIAALETHVFTPGPRLPFPISAFGGEDDHRTPRSDLEAWGGETNTHFRVRMFPGDHFYLDPHRAAVVEAVSEIALRHTADANVRAAQ
ncbi:MAG TPA: alpha/beta fold hydrolase [Xanthobacteraceae bacterium]|nr:alpha/beta fold hydrolase [Xanthobacteraceae bacterium]